MELLSQPLELKSLDDDGSFEGIAAAYGNVERIPLLFREAEGLPFVVGTDKLNRPANMVPHEGVNNGTAQPAA